jgi:hypothetical protein
MNNELTKLLYRVLESSRGLGEPKYDGGINVVNWPDSFKTEVQQLVDGFYSAGNADVLRACSDILHQAPQGVPRGLIQILARALFDNPDTPLKGS